MTEPSEPKWIIPYYSRYYSKKKTPYNTGSKLMDLILEAGDYGWKMRDDAVLRDEVIELILKGENLGFAGDYPSEILGCYPSRTINRLEDQRDSLLTNALYLRIPAIADCLIEYMTPEQIRVGQAIDIARRGSEFYVGHIREYRKLLKKMLKKCGG